MAGKSKIQPCLHQLRVDDQYGNAAVDLVEDPLLEPGRVHRATQYRHLQTSRLEQALEPAGRVPGAA